MRRTSGGDVVVGGVAVTTLVLALVLGVYGYVSNIVKLARCDFQAPYKAEVLRITGVCIGPVGSVMGFCGFQDGPAAEAGSKE